MRRIEEAVDLTFPAAAAVSAALLIAFFLPYHYRPGDWASKGIDFVQHDFLRTLVNHCWVTTPIDSLSR